MAKDFKTPETVAFVSVRYGEILAVEDLMEDTPDWTLGCGLPRRRPCASALVLRDMPRPIRVQETREQVLAEVDPDGKLFLRFVWRDPK